MYGCDFKESGESGENVKVLANKRIFTGEVREFYTSGEKGLKSSAKLFHKVFLNKPQRVDLEV